jgi:decaprenylphospho-beta-D-ribofuranose 2-oxidase
VSADRALLAGWGRTPATMAHLEAPTAAEAVAALVADPPRRGVIARGLGRSYGDPALNAGGTVIDCTGLTGITAADLTTGVITAAGGTSLDHLMRVLVPLGWFVPVTPGTRFVTVGGAIASDIHGKNHHLAGSFANFVDSVTLLVPGGATRTIGPTADPDLFWATVGGMGLTGIILDATIRLSPITTSRLVVDTERTTDLDDCLTRMTDTDHHYRYSVAWIDCLAQGSSLGRSVLTRGEFATPDQLTRRARRDPLRFRTGALPGVPDAIPSGLLNRFTVAAFNEAWYRKSPKERRGEIQEIPTFFHPLDAVADWNRLYGRTGMLQHQFVVPIGAEDTLRHIIEQLAGARCASFLAVLKRYGPGNPGLLSFPMPGWSLALDMPASGDGLSDLLDRIDDQVVEAGGRLYLAKDSRMRPELLEAMYPRLDDFHKIRAAVDPDNTLQSDQARRLGL